MLEEHEVSSTRKEILSVLVSPDEELNVVNWLTVKYCGGVEQPPVGRAKVGFAEKIAANAKRICAAIIIVSVWMQEAVDRAGKQVKYERL